MESKNGSSKGPGRTGDRWSPAGRCAPARPGRVHRRAPSPGRSAPGSSSRTASPSPRRCTAPEAGPSRRRGRPTGRAARSTRRRSRRPGAGLRGRAVRGGRLLRPGTRARPRARMRQRRGRAPPPSRQRRSWPASGWSRDRCPTLPRSAPRQRSATPARPTAGSGRGLTQRRRATPESRVRCDSGGCRYRPGAAHEPLNCDGAPPIGLEPMTLRVDLADVGGGWSMTSAQVRAHSHDRPMLVIVGHRGWFVGRESVASTTRTNPA